MIIINHFGNQLLIDGISIF